MDKKIRRNEICIIGLPRCDFVFSSTRNCFIAYGFEESTLEMTILKRLLKDKGIEPIEAGGTLVPAQNAFCAKICSKIINSQFCIILLNNDLKDSQEIPNANVNMEYGLMLGFNKYVVPFQKKSQKLPFNVAGLDTVKYDSKDFERQAKDAIEQAIKETQQDVPQLAVIDQILESFILTKKAVMTSLRAEGDKDIFDLGRPLGFNLLNDFGGFIYIFLGNFTSLRPEIILWRVRILDEIHKERGATLEDRVKLGIVTKEQVPAVKSLLGKMQIWLIVSSKEDKMKISQSFKEKPISLKTEIFSMDDMYAELEKLGKI